MKTIFCKLCKIPIVANVWGIHVRGRKHTHFTPSSITVSGNFDVSEVEKVNNYLSQFGSILEHKVTTGEEGVSIDYIFHEPRSHSIILQRDHKFFGHHLRVTWSEVTTPPPPPLNPKFLIPKYNNRPPSNRMLSGSSSRHESSSTESQDQGEQDNKAKKVDNANSEVTKQEILNSLKEVTSFADQVLLLQSKLQGDRAELENNRKIIHNDLNIALSSMFSLNKINFFGSSVTGLDVKGSDLDVFIANVKQQSKPEIATLKIIRHLIFKSRKFCDVLLISGAKIPIIKCIHTRTQLCCDLNIKNQLSVRNSELIKYYLTLDEKLRSLMIVIKFWADMYDLKKVNFFSSYALYMMVIFYLQQEPYKLPSVKDLQEDTPPDFVEGWNCAFKAADFNSPHLKEASIFDLVLGFYRFYGNFDYVSYVISPFYGAPIEKTRFLKEYDLPGCFHSYTTQSTVLTVNSGICIQDPFELARNVSAAVPLFCIGKFINLCRFSATLMEKGEKELLYKLLTSNSVLEYRFSIIKDKERDEQKWIESVKSITMKTLTDVLSLKVSKTKATNCDFSYHLQGVHNIWDNRINIFKNLLSQLPPEINDFDREVAVTECILKYFPQSLSTSVNLALSFKKNPSRVEVTLKNVGKCKIYSHIGHFLSCKLPKFLAIFVEDKDVDAKIPSTEVSIFEEKNEKEIQSNTDEMIKTENKISEETNNCSNSSQNKQVDSLMETGTLDGQAITDGIETNDDSQDEILSKQEEGNADEAEEEEEEDVPADFFDDFSNQDFMDGLDIVDAWDEESKVPVQDEELAKNQRKHSPIRFTPVTDRKSPDRRPKRPARSRSRSLTRRYNKRSNSHTRRRSRSRSREKNRAVDRRDPEKTKRDISKDKLKCAKDREQKLVNDKLKIVETGLVPPGTEMDVDISAIMREKRRSATGSGVEKVRESKVSVVERERPRRFVRRSLSRERERPRERERKLPKRSRSPVGYRSRVREREREDAHRSRKRTSSMESTLSERELWIRSGRKRSRSRSRNSPSSRSKAKKYEEAKKKSFLEEIRDKLNETRPAVPVPTPQAPIVYNLANYNRIPHPMPVPTPAPVPAPTQFFPNPTNQPQMQQYDQSFFIGEAYPNAMTQPQGFNMMGNTGNVVPVQINQIQQPAPVHTPPVPVIESQQQKPVASPKISLPIPKENVAKFKETEEINKKTSADDIDKLFADKKISLSDFLTITAKSEVNSSNPDHLQKKIKVISRCQDAIRVMSDDRKFTGRLSVKPTSETKNKTDVKYQSPLRRIPIVRFQFTTPTKISEEFDAFAQALDRILQKVGIMKEAIDLDMDVSTDSINKTFNNSSFADEEAAVLTLKASMLGSKKFEVVGCEECKKRKLKTFAEVGSQCAYIKETNEISTQVTEEDLTPAKGLPKNDSIAYLTPAQLLGKGKEKEKEGEKPIPEKLAEKKNPEPLLPLPEVKNDKPRPNIPNFKPRGGFRKTLRDRSYFEEDYDYDYDYYNGGGRNMFEDPRENFGPSRYGGGPPVRLNQFIDKDMGFSDFSQPKQQPFRGRGGRYNGPRY